LRGKKYKKIRALYSVGLTKEVKISCNIYIFFKIDTSAIYLSNNRPDKGAGFRDKDFVTKIHWSRETK